MAATTLCLGQVWGEKAQELSLLNSSGFANFIDEWSHCDSCFTNFGVILEYLESSITDNEKSHFQTFQHMVLSCIHCREGYTK